ncbi:tnfrsf1b [Pungitius sinensis]
MKDILVALLLLNVQTLKVCSKPYQADSDGNCLNSTTEYLSDNSQLCCKKCPPGHRQTQECSETTETVCERCPPDHFMENWNYAPNCFYCAKCKPKKGLQDAQVCSSTQSSRCKCQPNMFCLMEFDDPFCTACSRYTPCLRGAGVFVQGTANTDVKCKQCPSGTFSDTVSSTKACRPHTDCKGRVLVMKGNATADNVCEPQAFAPTAWPRGLDHRPPDERDAASTVSATLDSKAPRGQTEATLPIRTSSSRPEINPSTKPPPPGRLPGVTLVAVIASVIGLLLFFIAIVLLFICKPVWKKDDAARFIPKLDANGNCERVDKLGQDYIGENHLNYIKVPSPEHQSLLQRGETCSDHSQCSNTTLTQTDGSSSQESIGPLQSTVALHSQLSVLSDPMTLLSHTEAATPQPNVSAQSTSQPTSPQVISPVTTSPHVNVNITFHIENRSCGTPSVTPTDLMQVDSKLPFGEEESFSIPHQEAGKQSLMSVQDSDSCNA